MEKLFNGTNGDFDIKQKHINDKGNYVITSGIKNNGILGKTNVKAKVFNSKTITVDMFGFAFYRNFKYKLVTHARVFSLEPKFKISKNQGLFLSSLFHFINKKFGYENMCTWGKIKETKIQLPIKHNEIDFEFMENFIDDLEKNYILNLENEKQKKKNAYLSVANLTNYDLTSRENEILNSFINEDIEWGEFNLEDLFGKSTRGKRLKSIDRIAGNLPFVTAGEINDGISSYIGNNVTVFSKNTITIDMFGSAKYRDYDYGADDHIAVVHTENITKLLVIFITIAINKSSNTGNFTHSRNFYTKDADNLYISLPVKNNEIDFEFMKTFILIMQKLVIKDFVCSEERKIKIAKHLINKNEQS